MNKTIWNPYTKNLTRLEFVVTYACTGRCIHCSEGDHTDCGTYMDAGTAEKAVRDLAGAYPLSSVMTFGGEPLLRPETVYAVHEAAREAGIVKRQLITNGYFSNDSGKIREVCARLASCGVNDVLLSADAFHQEHIPLKPVLLFASELQACGVPLRMNPAWLVSREDDNPYNRRTKEILQPFEDAGIRIADGNIVFPAGNALCYLADYFDLSGEQENPYREDPFDLRAVSINPDGTIDPCGSIPCGSVYDDDILTVLSRYVPAEEKHA